MSHAGVNGALEKVQTRIVNCERCPRLRKYCRKIAIEKRPKFRDETYWGRPVPGFGDPSAELLMVGLAPAAHGGNRTGRMFTGDNSGLWLYRALFRAGFSNQEHSISRTDGLKLTNAFITAAIRCAPPGNKPLPQELDHCAAYLQEELGLFSRAKVYLVLGQLALKTLWRLLPTESKPQKALPKFKHGLELPLLDGRVLMASFHPSQQNTFTGKLTEPMFDSIFVRIREFLPSSR